MAIVWYLHVGSPRPRNAERAPALSGGCTGRPSDHPGTIATGERAARLFASTVHRRQPRLQRPLRTRAPSCFGTREVATSSRSAFKLGRQLRGKRPPHTIRHTFTKTLAWPKPTPAGLRNEKKKNSRASTSAPPPPFPRLPATTFFRVKTKTHQEKENVREVAEEGGGNTTNRCSPLRYR